MCKAKQEEVDLIIKTVENLELVWDKQWETYNKGGLQNLAEFYNGKASAARYILEMLKTGVPF
jgi:hypothetical protein